MRDLNTIGASNDCRRSYSTAMVSSHLWTETRDDASVKVEALSNLRSSVVIRIRMLLNYTAGNILSISVYPTHR